tara:strand:+ start:3299 stop:3520 length:222 start_codon:yes stop_codon:yes gene_type:complete
MASDSFKKYKITIWFEDKEVSGYRYLPEGKVTAMRYLRPIVESLPDFYFVLGYKIENEKDLGILIPDELCKKL